MLATRISRFRRSPLSGPFHIRRASALLGVLLALISAPTAVRAGVFAVTNLVTDDQTVNKAQITDPALVNAWGISFPPAGTQPLSPFWVSDNGMGVATLYDINPATNATTKLGLTVSIPGDGSVTGQVFNSTAAGGTFNGDAFLFVSEDGTISGWKNGNAAETLQSASSSNVYKGTTLATVGGNAYLYAANFRAGTIDVLKGNAAAPNLTGNFTDPGIPSG